MKNTPPSKDLITKMADGDSVPSTAVLKKSLKDLGISFRESGRRVQLQDPLELLDKEKLRANLNPEALELISSIETHWSIGSTNTYLMDRTGQQDFHGLICLAEQQVSGRGRRGRHWVSPFAKNISLSIGWQLSSAVGIAGLSLVIGMQVVKSLRSMGLVEVGLKWPNDVLLNGGKLCGILIEIGTPKKGNLDVVIGVGVNLQLDPIDAKEIDQPWSTVSDVTHISRNELVSLLISNLILELERFSKTGFMSYRENWREFDLYFGQDVRVLIGDRVVEGTDHGVDEEGNLLLKTKSRIETFNAGEVSLRPADY
ncbi:MAG: bifunctional biotin--[acetyl-CoA-carboxylase] ligase/biotin operon repressor BirA [bacterium]